jgi:NAD(P)-dependent dehydrogenase (short-subunit alcohol dehydrogenase family)
LPFYARRFEDKVVLITGAGTGIGRAAALRFAKEGANVVVVDIKKELADEVVKEIQSIGTKALPITADATRPEEIQKSIVSALSTFGKIDVLVNNVGLFKSRPIMEVKEAEWDPMFNINVKSTFLWSQAVGKHMIERHSGSIVNLSSDAGKLGDPLTGLYSATKHAVIGLTKNMALNLAPYGIRVNAVCPGNVDTKMHRAFREEHGSLNKKSPDELLRELLSTVPLNRLARPDEIASVIAFLASDDASYMTGQAINITGGGLML